MDKSYLIYGNVVKNIKAVDIVKNTAVVLFTDNKITKHDFKPFLWTTDFIDDMKTRFKHHECEELQGSNEYNRLIHFNTKSEYFNAQQLFLHLKIPFLKVNDMSQQFMIQKGYTLFKGITLSDLRTLYFDIETLKGVSLDDNEIACISVKCGDFETVIEGTQEEIIDKFVATIKEQDPDIIGTYNGESFDWVVIYNIAQKLRKPLKIGRYNTPLYKYKTTVKLNETQTVFIEKFGALGRHIIDFYYLTKRFNVIRRVFDSYGLKDVVKTLGMTRDDRTMVDTTKLSELWANPVTREQVKDYCLDDSRDLEILSKLLLPTEFYQAQMLPISFEKLCISGTANKLNSIFYRYYYKHKHSIPMPNLDDKRDYQGGLVGNWCKGVYRDVCKVDIGSMYPSIILLNKIKPPKDYLDVFLKTLTILTEKRLSLKNRMKAFTGNKKEIADGIQGAYKVIINSSYGILASNASPFAYPKGAEKVTEEGRAIITAMKTALDSSGLNVLSLDTDGIFVS